MSQKRSRRAYEADSQATDTPFVVFGTPLPAPDSQTRDAGSYVPIHKQEVRDSQGRRRLHGAFTGGWSAGYFNTVGSKEGWTPTTFVSSRLARHKGDPNKQAQQRPEDFMDEEDLADVAEAQRIQTTDSFGGIGGRPHADSEGTGLMEAMLPQGHTMGFSLLRKMGWRDGQGIGPKVRRAARLQDTSTPGQSTVGGMHLFAPDDVAFMQMMYKLDRRGLGSDPESNGRRTRVTNSPPPADFDEVESNGRETYTDAATMLSVPFRRPKRKAQRRGGIGIGVLNETGSDDENDPYSMGPRILLNRSLGSAKPKKGDTPARTLTTNPALSAKLTFTSKRVASTAAKYQDGAQTLPGFSLPNSEAYRVTAQPDATYPPPVIPPGWTPSRASSLVSAQSMKAPTVAELSKTTPLDPRSRAAALGEALLPGKSVFDFMTTEARERIAVASGKTNLPQAKGEIPAGYAVTDPQKLREGIQGLPQLEKETALAAINRGRNAGAPYADDNFKQSRYRAYLEHVAYGSDLPPKPDGMTTEEFVQELAEFHGCARLFKPLTGFMASRFTTASSTPLADSKLGFGTSEIAGVSNTAQLPPNPMEEAAKMGMYGHVTRSTHEFYPSRLLCKRFNVRPPDHVTAAPTTPSTAASNSHPKTRTIAEQREDSLDSQDRLVVGSKAMNPRFRAPSATTTFPDTIAPRPNPGASVSTLGGVAETEKPSEDVFRSIFGDSSDEES